MYSSIEVLRIAGPEVGPTRRGARFIDLGFMQTAKFTAKNGTYFDLNQFQMVSSVQGKTYIDSVPSAGNVNVPWYNKRYLDQEARRNYFEVKTDDVIESKPFDMSDSPDLSAVPQMVVDGYMVGQFALITDFVVYFAVHTKEQTNAANDSNTIRASVPWRWNASGNVDGGQVGIGLPTTGRWTLSLPAGVTTLSTPANPTELTESRVGDIVPTALTRGRSAAVAVAGQAWTRNPPLPGP
jgi:hypothetical protein